MLARITVAITKRFIALTVMFCVVLLTADLPQIRIEGLAATRKVLLGFEVLLVSRDRGKITLTRLDHLTYRSKTVACSQLILGGRRRALVCIRRLGIDALTVRVGGRSRTVRHDQVVTVLVTVLFLGF